MTENNNSKLLPLGSIVTLKEGDGTKLLIIGRMTITIQNDKQGYYEYSAVLFPMGITDSEQILFFNSEDIKDIIFTGFVNDEEESHVKELNELIKQNTQYPKFGIDN